MSDLVAIIVPDTAPLIHLAAGGLLHVLPALGRVIIPDVVQIESTRLAEKPWAQDPCSRPGERHYSADNAWAKITARALTASPTVIRSSAGWNP